MKMLLFSSAFGHGVGGRRVHNRLGPNADHQNPPIGTKDGVNIVDDNTVIIQLRAPAKAMCICEATSTILPSAHPP